jgi:hypothetical protein
VGGLAWVVEAAAAAEASEAAEAAWSGWALVTKGNVARNAKANNIGQVHLSRRC